MTALTDSRHTPVEEITSPRRMQVGTDVVYKGGLVMHGAGASTIVAAADTEGGRLAGLCEEEVDNSAGASDKYAEVRTGILVRMSGSGFAAGDEGYEVFVEDDGTVTKTMGNVSAGVIVEVISSTEVMVDIYAARALTALHRRKQSHIDDPSGGTTVDAEARTAINLILDALQAYGILETS